MFNKVFKPPRAFSSSTGTNSSAMPMLSGSFSMGTMGTKVIKKDNHLIGKLFVDNSKLVPRAYCKRCNVEVKNGGLGSFQEQGADYICYCYNCLRDMTKKLEEILEKENLHEMVAKRDTLIVIENL